MVLELFRSLKGKNPLINYDNLNQYLKQKIQLEKENTVSKEDTIEK